MFKNQLSLASASLLALTLLTTACGSKDPQPDSLYVRMGGKTGVEAVATQQIANVSAEIGADTPSSPSIMKPSHLPLLNDPNSQARKTALLNNLIDQFTDITGGPIKYKGKSLLVAHVGMHLTELEWTTWRGLLDQSLASNKIGTKEKAEFTALIDAMKSDVVNH